MTKEWLEELNDDEWAYLKRRYKSQVQKIIKGYKIVATILLVANLIFSALLLMGYYVEPPEEYILRYRPEEVMTLDKILMYSVGCFIGTQSIVLLGFYCAYLIQLSRIRADIKHRLKIVEMATIKQKMYMPHNNTYHFILDSQYKYSFEVSEDEYNFYQIGDEINIELTQYAKIELGNF